MATATSRSSLAPAVAKRMAAAAQGFLDSLSANQRQAAMFPFAGDERYVWAYTPVSRNGLMLRAMTPPQRTAAFALMETAYSGTGFQTAREIIALETILHEWEEMTNEPSRWPRDAEQYWFSVFGTPGSKEPWGWRAGGHHIGLHLTIVDGDLLSQMPLFFGANPAEVRHGPNKGTRTLPFEEDGARALLRALNAEQRKIAVVDPVAPADILTHNYRTAERGQPLKGLACARMTGDQRELFLKLVRHYVGRAQEDLARNQWRKFESDGLDAATFAWAGPDEKGKGHYYSIVGPRFMIEYDNTQNGANHIHSVLREFDGDWGEDLLAAHYKAAHPARS
ncbi:MAG: DUF3500 domain-containing protein [Chloroflexi bacterium]|nr:DUF3500 domain-containing protein [Chloroflexota bacterium]